ncbi:hypothetical protein ABK040_006852 [Willaertia magna]
MHNSFSKTASLTTVTLEKPKIVSYLSQNILNPSIKVKEPRQKIYLSELKESSKGLTDSLNNVQKLFNNNLEWLMEQEESVENCVVPIDFLSCQPFPRKKKLTPQFVINTVIKKYYRKHVYSKEIKEILTNSCNLQLVLDSFWNIFVNRFSERYLWRKANRRYSIEESSNSDLITHPPNRQDKERAKKWVDYQQTLLFKELVHIDKRMSKNFAELVVIFIENRKKNFRMCKIQEEIDTLYIDFMTKVLFLSFGMNFPESSHLFETEEFQKELCTKFNEWCLGIPVLIPSNITLLKYDEEDLERNFKSSEITETKTDPIRRLKKAVSLVKFIERAKKGMNKNNEEKANIIQLEEILERLSEVPYAPSRQLEHVFGDIWESEPTKRSKEEEKEKLKSIYKDLLTEEDLEEIKFETKLSSKKKKQENRFSLPKSIKTVKNNTELRKKAWYETKGDSYTLNTKIYFENRSRLMNQQRFSKNPSPLMTNYLRHVKQSKLGQERNVKSPSVVRTSTPVDDLDFFKLTSVYFDEPGNGEEFEYS